MVVQGGVQVGVAHSGPVASAFGTALGVVPAAVGDEAEFLDVDVDQFAGPGALVAADGFAGGPVSGGQSGQAVPAEDAVRGGRGDAAPGGQAHRTDPVLVPQP